VVIGAAAVDGDDDGDYFLVLVLFLVVDEADCLVGGLVRDVEEGGWVLLVLLGGLEEVAAWDLLQVLLRVLLLVLLLELLELLELLLLRDLEYVSLRLHL